MWAGGSIETLRPLRHGERIIRTSSISAISMKRGSAGDFCLVSIQHEISDGRGTAIRERQDLAFREQSSVRAEAVGAGQALRTEWHVEASPLLLFRFSAFTFNGHRIHYDLAHAQEEGYPGVLVQGSLQAALMLNLAAHHLRATPRRFVYRCLAPLYGGERFGVSFEADGAITRIIRSDGFTAAEGQAHAQAAG
jgi:3-methylfumaryl-CoA hydratase